MMRIDKRWMAAAAALCLGAAALPAQSSPVLRDRHVEAVMIGGMSHLQPGVPYRVGLLLRHDPGWHTYTETSTTGYATTIEWRLPAGFEAGAIAWPPPVEYTTQGVTDYVYKDEVLLVTTLTPPADLPAGELTIGFTADWLMCENVCVPGGVSSSITLPVKHAPAVPSAEWQPYFERADAARAAAAGAAGAATAAAAPPAPGLGLGILLLAFAGGLVLNLMPCVFPVLGIKIMGFVSQAGEARGKIAGHGLVFTAGVLLSFWLLAGLLLALRSGGSQLGWGFQLQSPGFVLALTLILFAFGLNMSGLFEVGQTAVGVGSNLTARSGLAGSFFSGVLATLVATPCAAPFLAPALGAALALTPLASIAVFTLIALGLATPYLLLSVFPGLLKWLPRPGAWMETFKQAMAFLLYGTVAYLAWVLAGQLSEEAGYPPFSLLKVLAALVLLALALWIYGRWAAYHRPAKVRLAGVAAAVLVLLAALGIGFSGTRAPAAGAHDLAWEKWEPGKAEQLAAAGRIVYVDFTARWCVTCQTNKAAVFASGQVLERIRELDVVLLKADWTNQDPAISAALARFNRSAVPFNLVYAPGRPEPQVLPEILTPGTVLDSLEAAAGG